VTLRSSVERSFSPPPRSAPIFAGRTSSQSTWADLPLRTESISRLTRGRRKRHSRTLSERMLGERGWAWPGSRGSWRGSSSRGAARAERRMRARRRRTQPPDRTAEPPTSSRPPPVDRRSAPLRAFPAADIEELPGADRLIDELRANAEAQLANWHRSAFAVASWPDSRRSEDCLYQSSGRDRWFTRVRSVMRAEDACMGRRAMPTRTRTWDAWFARSRRRAGWAIRVDDRLRRNPDPRPGECW
jgi:hypothetical protein